MVKISEIIKQSGKYHFVYMNGKKPVYLSGSNSSSEAKQMALDKLDKHLDKLENSRIYRVVLKKISSAELKKDAKKQIPLMGGPICGIVETYRIRGRKINTNKREDDVNVYFTVKYLKKNLEIKRIDIKYIVFAEYLNFTRGFGRINTVENLRRKLKK